MRTKLIFFIFILFSGIGFAQISTTRMNELKIGMRPADVLKMLGKKPAAIADNSEMNIKVNGIDYTIDIGNGYLSKTENDPYIRSIGTESNKIKTLSGLGIGSNLEELWKAYSGKYNFFLNKSENNFREFRIDDKDNCTMLIFRLKNEIVIKIELNSYNPEECTL